MSVKVYVEGGGNGKALKRDCARGFKKFAERAGIEAGSVRFVACGSRQDAYEDFANAQAGDDGFPFLLVDSEAPISAPAATAKPWEHLRSRDGWTRPDGSSDDQCHLMVQVMESWFLADRTTLASYYGQHFLRNALPGNPRIEDVPKTQVLSTLTHAARRTQKGAYSKGGHSFAILERIDARAVEEASPYAKRFLDALRGRGERLRPT